MLRRRKGKIEEPFSDWPKLQVLADEGAVHLSGKYTAPSFWWSRGLPLLVLMLTPILLPGSCSAMNGGNLDGMTGEEAIAFTILYAVVVFVGLALAEYFGRKRRLHSAASMAAMLPGHFCKRCSRHRDTHPTGAARSASLRAGVSCCANNT